MNNKQYLFKQYRPAFFEGFENAEFYFKDYGDLIKKYKTKINKDPLLKGWEFCCDSYKDYHDASMLMVRNKNKKEWFVLGFAKNFHLEQYLSQFDDKKYLSKFKK